MNGIRCRAESQDGTVPMKKSNPPINAPGKSPSRLIDCRDPLPYEFPNVEDFAEQLGRGLLLKFVWLWDVKFGRSPPNGASELVIL